jgi:hypothetical protein
MGRDGGVVFFFSPRLSLRCTFAVPALGTYWLVRTGRVSSLLLPNHRERSLPLLLAFIGFAAGAGLLYAAAPLLCLALGLQAVAVALTGGISRYWLISAHCVAMGGTVGFAVVLGQLAPNVGWWPVVASGVLAGAVAAARLTLNAHTRAQVGAGLALGLGVGLGATIVI